VKIKVGIMGSADDAITEGSGNALRKTAEELGRSIARRDALLLTGATTGVIRIAGLAARAAGVFHIGISPANSINEHVGEYGLPLDACDAIVYTGFGLKGRNVVLVRSCDIVLFIAGSVGALNEFTIAYDEGKIIGCLLGTGGVADEAAHLVKILGKPTRSKLFYDEDPDRLLDKCFAALERETSDVQAG
jgi:uncharacterized protein (TIGR00725 family)